MNLRLAEKARAVAEEKYLSAKKKLMEPQLVECLSAIAQEAQDAYDEFKKLDAEFNNTRILKKMGDLYGI